MKKSQKTIKEEFRAVLEKKEIACNDYISFLKGLTRKQLIFFAAKPLIYAIKNEGKTFAAIYNDIRMLEKGLIDRKRTAAIHCSCIQCQKDNKR